VDDQVGEPVVVGQLGPLPEALHVAEGEVVEPEDRFEHGHGLVVGGVEVQPEEGARRQLGLDRGPVGPLRPRVGGELGTHA
jgi:hypothetical protein